MSNLDDFFDKLDAERAAFAIPEHVNTDDEVTQPFIRLAACPHCKSSEVALFDATRDHCWSCGRVWLTQARPA